MDLERLDDWRAAGAEAFAAGRSANENPAPFGSPARGAWLNGWHLAALDEAVARRESRRCKVVQSGSRVGALPQRARRSDDGGTLL